MPRNAKRKVDYWNLVQRLPSADYREFIYWWDAECRHTTETINGDLLKSKAREWYTTVYKPRKQS